MESRPLRSCLAFTVVLACDTDTQSKDYSIQLRPTKDESYYLDQADKYFDALDESSDPASLPSYSTLVARWEWPPWLYLTGLGAMQMEALDESVKSLTPATIDFRDCIFFPVQPFARCRVTFEYDEGPCPIYEEFTFNDQGEITFIEAWSDLPGMLPFSDPEDTWAEGPQVHRMSTKLPGLGNATGLIEINGDDMREDAKADPEIADFRERAQFFWASWGDAYEAAGDDLFARGCGWSQ